MGMADGWSAHLLVYLGWYIDLWVGWSGMDFNLSAYCSDRRSRLLYIDSSFRFDIQTLHGRSSKCFQAK